MSRKKTIKRFLRMARDYVRFFAPSDALAAIRTHLAGTRGGFKRQMALAGRKMKDQPVWMRIPSSDIFVYKQIFVKREYDLEVDFQPEVIIDAGANSGFSALFFASRFPGARIIAIEPEDENFALLQKNTADNPYIIPIQAGLWSKSGRLSVVDIGAGEWGYVVVYGGEKEARQKLGKKFRKIVQEIRAVSIDDIMDEYDLDKIDILKIDIEGSEKKVFEHADGWIDQTGAILIELHERFAPGCEKVVHDAARNFSHSWRQGENIIFSRGDCRPAGNFAKVHKSSSL